MKKPKNRKIKAEDDLGTQIHLTSYKQQCSIKKVLDLYRVSIENLLARLYPLNSV